MLLFPSFSETVLAIWPKLQVLKFWKSKSQRILSNSDLKIQRGYCVHIKAEYIHCLPPLSSAGASIIYDAILNSHVCTKYSSVSCHQLSWWTLGGLVGDQTRLDMQLKCGQLGCEVIHILWDPKAKGTQYCSFPLCFQLVTTTPCSA